MQTLAIEQPEEAFMHDCLKPMMDSVWRSVSPVWPLNPFIASNPLADWMHLPFKEAVEEAYRHDASRSLPTGMKAVNRETIKWCQLYFDVGQAQLSMPHRELGLYHAWRKLSVHDALLHKNSGAAIEWIKALPDNPEEAIALCLEKLQITPEKREEFLTQILSSLPGWAGCVRFHVEWSHTAPPFPYPVNLADYLAVRLAITALLWPEAKELTYRKNDGAVPFDWNVITKREQEYRDQLTKRLYDGLAESSQPQTNPEAQLIFCIDVRSEPLRRALEQQGKDQTFGFAGFFGLPIRVHSAVTGKSSSSCPALINPSFNVHDTTQPRALSKLTTQLYNGVKYNFTTCFGLVETAGIFSAVSMALRTLAPTLIPKRLEAYPKPILDDIPFDKRCDYAESLLRAIGLTTDFASTVVLCGHGSETRNNAYHSALQCGACGGRSGGLNADVMASLFNDAQVRRTLKTRGITIPDTTHFIAAEHNTTTHEVRLFSENSKLSSRLKTAQQAVIQKEASRKAVDWSETRPEWGLARNASFIVGPRKFTSSIDLDGRSFLHSYDWKTDGDGSILEQILSAPVVVAQWINAQYFFSSVDNERFGSGSKIRHNITGKMGTLLGNASDLQGGLPMQSVNIDDTTPYHEPIRLQVFVYAPKEHVDKVIIRMDGFKQYIDNEWITLTVIE